MTNTPDTSNTTQVTPNDTMSHDELFVQLKLFVISQ